MNLESLVQECFQLYLQTYNTFLPITNPSIPILYFGNYPTYKKSETKIITVGLNPSHKEFPLEDRFLRFRKAEETSPSPDLDQYNVRLLRDSLNEYFKNERARANVLLQLGLMQFDGAVDSECPVFGLCLGLTCHRDNRGAAFFPRMRLSTSG